MEFNPNRLKFGDLVGGGAGLVLLISLFLDWYSVSIQGPAGRNFDIGSGNAWDVFDLWAFILLLISLAAIGAAVVRALDMQLPLRVPISTIVMGLGALATLYILFRVVNPPGNTPDGVDVGRGIGLWLGLLASIAITAGGFLSARERGEAVPGVDGALGGTGGAGGAGGPLGGGDPAGGGYAAQPGAGQPVGGGYAGQPGGVGAGAAGAADPGAAAAAPGGPKADWYPDPQGTARLRYWDGTQWTDQTAD